MTKCTLFCTYLVELLSQVVYNNQHSLDFVPITPNNISQLHEDYQVPGGYKLLENYQIFYLEKSMSTQSSSEMKWKA